MHVFNLLLLNALMSLDLLLLRVQVLLSNRVDPANIGILAIEEKRHLL